MNDPKDHDFENAANEEQEQLALGVQTKNLPIPPTPDESNTTQVLTIYQNMSVDPLPKECEKTILEPADGNLVELKDRQKCIIYMPGVHWRKRLTEAFGLAGWALKELEVTINAEQEQFFYKGALFVHGRFIAQAIGAQQYFNNNKSQNYSDAYEAAKTDCITRCCKDLSMFSELWQPYWIAAWKKNFAVQAWCKSDKGEKLPLWRLKREDPYNGFYLKINKKQGYYWTEEPPRKGSAPKTQPKYTPEQLKSGAAVREFLGDPEEMNMPVPINFDGKTQDLVNELGGVEVNSPVTKSAPSGDPHETVRFQIAVAVNPDKTTKWMALNAGKTWADLKVDTLSFIIREWRPPQSDTAARERCFRGMLMLIDKVGAKGQEVFSKLLEQLNLKSIEHITADNHKAVLNKLKQEIKDITGE